MISYNVISPPKKSISSLLFRLLRQCLSIHKLLHTEDILLYELGSWEWAESRKQFLLNISDSNCSFLTTYCRPWKTPAWAWIISRVRWRNIFFMGYFPSLLGMILCMFCTSHNIIIIREEVDPKKICDDNSSLHVFSLIHWIIGVSISSDSASSTPSTLKRSSLRNCHFASSRCSPLCI